MKVTQCIAMKRLDATGVQYLHATATDAIPPGAALVLRKRDDGAFELVIVPQPRDETDVTRLASFLDPKLVDAIRDECIASVVFRHKPNRTRKHGWRPHDEATQPPPATTQQPIEASPDE